MTDRHCHVVRYAVNDRRVWGLEVDLQAPGSSRPTSTGGSGQVLRKVRD